MILKPNDFFELTLPRIHVPGRRFNMRDEDFIFFWIKTHEKRLKNLQRALDVDQTATGFLDMGLRMYLTRLDVIEHNCN